MGKSDQKLADDVRRTKSLMVAGLKLKDYRDQIDNLIKVINSGEEFHESLANECIEIGVTFQSLSKLLRPISIEGKNKAVAKRVKNRWKIAHAKAVKDKNSEWIDKYSAKARYPSFYSQYIGPTESFIKDFCSTVTDEEE